MIKHCIGLDLPYAKSFRTRKKNQGLIAGVKKSAGPGQAICGFGPNIF